MRSDDSNSDEDTPLLSVQSDDTPLKPSPASPFPTIQISVLVLPWIAETVMTYSISPYINQVGVTDGIFRHLRLIGVDLYFSSSETFRS
jgi:hypothetical protein